MSDPKGHLPGTETLPQVMSAELTDECSYTREAGFLRQFRSDEFLGKDERYKVPWVWKGSSDEVLVMEHVGGVGVGDVTAGMSEKGGVTGAARLNQQDRDDVGLRVSQSEL
jgi:aarF domain-containing kinase